MRAAEKNLKEKIGDHKDFFSKKKLGERETFKEKIWKVVWKQIKKSHEKNFYIKKNIR